MVRSIFYTGPSLSTLHRNYAKRGRIDDHAAIQAHADIIVRAPSAHVWQVLADVPNWPRWMPNVTSVRLESRVAADARFTWRSGSATIASTFAVVDPGKELTWTGVSFGAKAVDRHTLEPVQEGTRVFTEESMAGPFLVLFFNSEKLHAAQQALLAALKSFAEKAA